MQIEIHANDLSLSDTVREFLDRRIVFAFSRISARVKRIVVHLADVNGPRGGIDKRCSVQVHLHSAPIVVIEETDADLHVLLDRALSRAGRSAGKRIERSQQFDRIAMGGFADDRLGQMRDRRRRLPIQSRPHDAE